MNLIALIMPSDRRTPSLRLALLAWAMTLANRRPDDHWFVLKRDLLARYAVNDGYDLQRLDNRCWECAHPRPGSFLVVCQCCGGTGIYSTSYHRLNRLNLQGWLFHTPVRLSGLVAYQTMEPGARAIWTTRKDYGSHWTWMAKAAHECQLWFLLLSGNYRQWKWAMRYSKHCGFTARGIFPMLQLQAVIFESSMARYQVYDLRRSLALRWQTWATRLAMRLYPAQIPCRHHDPRDEIVNATGVACTTCKPKHHQPLDYTLFADERPF